LKGFSSKMPSRSILLPPMAILLALAIGALTILALGINPIFAYAALFQGAFGSLHSLTETFVKASPLLFTGLAAAVAFRCRVWNIGAEGQLYMGAVVTTWAGLTLVEVPAALLIPLLILLSFAAGAMWAVIAGALKAKFKVNEIILTLMLNFIAIYFVSYLVEGPWRDPSGITYSPPLTTSAWLPTLVSGTRLHLGILLAFVCAVFISLLFRKTVLGYKIQAIGANPEASRYAGIEVSKTIIIVMVISGGLAGLAGMGEIAGVQHRLMSGFSPWYGFLGILVAMLGKLRPFGIVVASILFGGLLVGGDAMQRVGGVPAPLVFVLQGLIVLLLLFYEHVFARFARS